MRVIVALSLAFILEQAPRDTPAGTVPPAARGTGIIKGRVVSADSGTAVHRAIVTIGSPGARPRDIYTDVRGNFEARNLPAGEYSVTARPNAYQAQFLAPPATPPAPDGSPRRVALAAGQTIEWHDIVLPRAGAIVGRVVDEYGEPISGVGVIAQRPGEARPFAAGSGQTSDEFGRYRVYRLPPGEYELVARPHAFPDARGDGPQLGFVETYYPNTVSRQESVRVKVRSGQETTVADLQLASARLLRITGIVVSSQPGRGDSLPMVGLSREGGGMSRGVDADGRFEFDRLPPGVYRLSGRRLSANRESTIEYGSVPLTLTDADADVVITMKPTVAVAGRVTFDGSAAAPVQPGALWVGPSVPQRFQYQDLLIPRARVGDDFGFEMRDLAGELLLRPSGVPNGWMLKAVLLGGDDITDTPREFRAEDSDRLQIVLTARWAELSGTVTDDKGQLVRSGTVVLFSDDRAAWFAESTRLRAAPVTRDGRFMLRLTRPGRYQVVTLPPDVRWDYQQIDRALLEQYAAEATAVVIGEDERRQIDLKVTVR